MKIRKVRAVLRFLKMFLRDRWRYPQYNPIIRPRVIGWTYYPPLWARLLWVARWGE